MQFHSVTKIISSTRCLPTLRYLIKEMRTFNPTDPEPTELDQDRSDLSYTIRVFLVLKRVARFNLDVLKIIFGFLYNDHNESEDRKDSIIINLLLVYQDWKCYAQSSRN
jgi:hypothetical protein